MSLKNFYIEISNAFKFDLKRTELNNVNGNPIILATILIFRLRNVQIISKSNIFIN